MASWKIVIEAWPYFDPPAVEAQAKVAPRVREFLIDAQSYDEAHRAARFIQMGIHSHDKVWEAPIKSVTEWPMPQASKE